MHTFAVVGTRPGRHLPPHVRRVLDAAAPPEITFVPDDHLRTFVPDDHLRWSDPRDCLHLAGWQAGAAHLGLGSHWEVRPGGVTAFSGHPLLDARPWRSGTSWASQVADLVPDLGADGLATRLDGVFNLVHLGQDGSGFVTGDPLGVGLTYQGHNEDIVAFSNRASLVARLLARPGQEPARDIAGSVLLAYANNLQRDLTTFVGVAPLPQASITHLVAGSEPRTHVWSTRPWIDAGLPTEEGPDLYGPALDHLRTLTRTLATLPVRAQRTLELTGGRDSRMILALLLAEDVAHDFRYVTWGGPDLPDVQVAGLLADRFGLRLHARGRPLPGVGPGGVDAPPTKTEGPSRPTKPPMAPDRLSFDAELRRHVWRTSGALSIWDLADQRRDPSPNLALTGQFGELLRTNYPRTTGIASMADLERYVRAGGFGFDAAGLLRRSARRHLDDQVVAQLRELQPAGGTAQDAVDGFNQQARLRRWFGTSHELDNRNRLFPLYSLPATRVAFAIGSRRRRLEALPFELLGETCPELATLPFAPSGWPSSLIAHLPDADRYPTSPDCPPWRPPRWPRHAWARRWRRRTGAAPTLAAEQRTMHDIEAKIPVLKAHLDLGPDHELFRYLDHDATMRAVDDLAQLDFLARRSVHDAVTAAMWAAGADHRDEDLGS